MAPILVTGATGFLGSTTCRQLVEAGMSVRAYARPGASHPTLDALQIERHWGNINDMPALRRAMTGCGAVIHTVVLGRYARRYWNELHLINARGTQCVLEACLRTGVERVTVLDTISGFPASRYAEVRVPDFVCDSGTLSLYPYLHSKMEARTITERYRDRLRIATLYCSPLYGAGDKHCHTGVLFQLLHRRLRIAPPGGTSVVSVEDAARACIMATTHPDAPDRMVVSSEHLSFMEIYNQILECVDPAYRIWRTIPSWCYFPAMATAILTNHFGYESQFTPYLIRNGFHFRYFDSEQTQQILGWEPRITIADAIRMQAAWMRTHGLLPAHA